MKLPGAPKSPWASRRPAPDPPVRWPWSIWAPGRGSGCSWTVTGTGSGPAPYGPAEASLTLACEIRGPVAPPPISLPPVITRVGVDLDPVDLADPEARAWLQACAPPEASALSRLAAAVDIARRHPATIIAGDIIDVLPRVLADIPAQQRIIVADAYTAVFLPEQRRAELAGLLAEIGQRRPVTWLSLDPLVPLGP